MTGNDSCLAIHLTIVLKISRKQLNEEAQHAPIENDDQTAVSRRVSESDPVCTCGFPPIKRAITTATTDSARTLYSPRESLSNISPRAVKSGYKPSRERTLSSTGSTAQEARESLTLKQRSYSVSTAKTSCSSCHDRVKLDDSVIGEYHYAPSFGNPPNE